MTTSAQDAELVWKLLWELLVFANQRKKVVPGIRSLEDYHRIAAERKLEIRDALWGNIHLIDDFTRANPAGFSDQELKIVSTWKHCLRGGFYIERYLKDRAIFIAAGKVYAVQALHTPFDQMIPRNHLPHQVEAVLLPFRGKIVYDGVLPGYNITFGGGIKQRLRENYLAAKQAGRIIESLDPDDQPKKQPASAVPAPDWKPALEDLARQAGKIQGGTRQHPFNSPAFGLIKASIELAVSVVDHPDDLDDLWSEYNKVVRAIRKVHTLFKRAESAPD